MIRLNRGSLATLPCLCNLTYFATQPRDGKIRDAETGAPPKGLLPLTRPQNTGTGADEAVSGKTRFILAPGVYEVLVAAEGYQSAAWTAPCAAASPKTTDAAASLPKPAA